MTSFRDWTQGPAWCRGLTLKIDLNVVPSSQPLRTKTRAHTAVEAANVCMCFGVESKDTDALCDLPRGIHCTATVDDVGILSAVCDKDQKSCGAHAEDKHFFISLKWQCMTALHDLFVFFMSESLHARRHLELYMNKDRREAGSQYLYYIRVVLI